jgi:hypothetical protein
MDLACEEVWWAGFLGVSRLVTAKSRAAEECQIYESRNPLHSNVYSKVIYLSS